MDHHYHSCPECYEKWKCGLDCQIEYDLADPIYHPGKEFSSHCVCPECDKTALTEDLWKWYEGFFK